MDPFVQATRLMTDTQYAAPIQVAVLIKQLLKADGVSLVKTSTDRANHTELVWREGELTPASRLETPCTLDAPGESMPESPLELIGQLYRQPRSGEFSQQTRLIHADAPECRTPAPCECYAAVYWQVSQGDHDLCYLWTRNNRPWLTHHEKQCFHQIRPLAARLLTQQTDDLPHSTQVRHSGGQHESAWGALSMMERKVLGLLQGGMTEVEVAQSLHRSPHTIHVHVKGLYRKFLVHSRAELIKAAKSRLVFPG